MSDWSAIETALETWVETITGLPSYWRGRPRAVAFDNAGYALLSISSRVTRGIDQVISEYDATQPAGSEIRTYQSGQRTFTFQIQIRTQEQSVDADAKNYTSLIRDSLRLPIKTVAALAVADIAVARVLAETDLDQTLDDRDLSVAQLDLLMNAKACLEDTAVGYISTIKDLDLQLPEGSSVWSGDVDLP